MNRLIKVTIREVPDYSLVGQNGCRQYILMLHSGNAIVPGEHKAHILNVYYMPACVLYNYLGFSLFNILTDNYTNTPTHSIYQPLDCLR